MGVTLLLSASPSTGTASGHADPHTSGDTITLGWTAWSDAQFVTRLARTLIEKHTDHPVELRLTGVARQYKAVASGRIDAMLMAWLPDTHADYYKPVANRVDDLGPIYNHARLGWAVPDYVPRQALDSISDLKKQNVRQKLGGRIQGIDPGSGLMQLSRKTLSAYGLGAAYRLAAASDKTMTRALARAEQKHRWIVVTAWKPHWIFARWNLRFLTDPRGTLGQAQHVDVLVRKGFSSDYPRVAGFLSRMHIPLAQLQAALYRTQDTSYKSAIARFIADHPKEIRQWFGTDTDAQSTPSN